MTKPIEIIGEQKVRDVIHEFYNLVFQHPIIKQFFVSVKQEHQETQFSDFMIQFLGGPSIYSGRMPAHAHPHLFITEEHFEIRHKLLESTLNKQGIPDEVKEIWLRIDKSFLKVIVKKDVDECSPRYGTDKIISAK